MVILNNVKCGEELKTGRMTRHLEKHRETIRKGGIVKRIKPAWEILEHCQRCKAPFPSYGPHNIKGCPLDRISYEYYNFSVTYPWVEVIPTEAYGYRIMKGRNFAFKCKRCNGLFPAFDRKGKNGFHAHLMTCEFGMEIITLWRITIPSLKGRI